MRRKNSEVTLAEFMMARRQELLNEIDMIDRVVARLVFDDQQKRTQLLDQLRASRQFSDTFADKVIRANLMGA